MPAAAVFPTVRIALAHPAFYRGFLGHRIDLFPGDVEIPEPAGQTAIAKGVGFPPSSAEGRLIVRALSTDANTRFETDGTGSVRVMKFTRMLGDDGKALPPAPPPVDLGMMPDTLGVIAEAAQCGATPSRARMARSGSTGRSTRTG